MLRICLAFRICRPRSSPTGLSPRPRVPLYSHPPFLEGDSTSLQTASHLRMKPCHIPSLILILLAAGCGTSKWTDTGRSATEQLLITDAMDRAVSELNLEPLNGRTCFIDATPLKKISDSEYLVSCLRQHMFASGCIVKDNKGEADYVVEVRAGAVGTDRHDVLYGIPAVNVPTLVPVSGIPSQIPEMPFVKKTDQRAVVKLSLFAYNQKTGRPLWQSGAVPEESKAKAVWVLGAGPFQRGNIYDGMEFAGDKIDMPLVDIYKPSKDHASVADQLVFPNPDGKIAPEEKVESAVASFDEKKPPEKPPGPPRDKAASVVPAGHAEPSDKNESTPPSPPPDSNGQPPNGPPPGQKPPNVQAPPELSADDLAPALTSLSLASEPGLLQTSGTSSAITPSRQIEPGTLPVPQLVIPE